MLSHNYRHVFHTEIAFLIEIPAPFEYIVHMWTHLFSLQALARELDGALQNAVIQEIFTQRKNELLVSISRKPQADQSLVISIDPKMNFLFMRDRTARAKKNSVDLFSEAVGLHISRVSLHEWERLIFFHLNGDFLLSAQLFETAESNVFLVDSRHHIRKAFKNSKKFEGKELEIRSGYDDAVLHSPAHFSSKLSHNSTASTFAALKSAVPFLGSTYAREVLHRAGVEEKSEILHLSKDRVESLYTEIIHLIESARTPQPAVYFRNSEPRVFSIVPLRHLSGAQIERFHSVNEAIRRYVFQSLQTQSFDALAKELIRKLKRERDRTHHTLTAVREELARTERAEQYERAANILMANLQHLTKGTKMVELEDIFSNGKEQLRIVLDPKLTPVQNAEHYFAKSKKARIARQGVEHRMVELEEKSALLEKLLLHLDYCQTKEQVEEFLNEHQTVLQKWNIVSRKDQSKPLPFRVFTVSGGFEVWVGKSSMNNDLLTMHYAKPNDLWFHVRGAGGSHVVLKVGGGKTKPSKEAIHEAGRIAAYYSKMRTASTVPVAYCERKYVRKPKGVEAGTVAIQREKVIFVEPMLP